MYQILISILLLLLPFSSLAKTHTSNANYSRPILVKPSRPVVVINLPANRTTGYSWFVLSYNNAFIKPASATYQTLDNKKRAGAPGMSRWTFKVNNDAFNVPHILHITMVYARPWDLKSARRKIITVVTR